MSVDVEIAKSDTKAAAVILSLVSNFVEATDHKGVGMSMTC